MHGFVHCHAWRRCALFFTLAVTKVFRALADSRISTAMSLSRLCLVAGGVLDFWSQKVGEPACLYNGHCPAGSVQEYQQCVAPEEESQAREIAITLQLGCDSNCLANEGVDISGTAWLTIARLLRVPLQETHAASLLISSNYEKRFPLEYFVVRPHVDDALISSPGASKDIADTWALFLALRIESTRIGAGASEMRKLVGGDASRLARLSGLPASQVHVFAAKEKRVAALDNNLGDLIPFYKIRSYAWNERPLDTAGSVGASPQSPAPAPTPPSCSSGCRRTMIGDGRCDAECNSEACSWDAGDCGGSSSGTSSSGTSDKLPGCSCETAWLGNGICETFCMYDACLFDMGDCSANQGSQVPGTTQPLVMPTPAPTLVQAECGCNSRWVGDGTCDHYCDNLACNFDGGDCSAVPQSQPNVLPTQPQPQGQPSPTPSSLRGSAQPSRNPNSQVVDFHIEGEDENAASNTGTATWRVVASDDADGKWYADNGGNDDGSGSGLVTGLAIGIFFAAAGLLTVVAVCLFVQKQKRDARTVSISVPRPSPIGANAWQPVRRTSCDSVSKSKPKSGPPTTERRTESKNTSCTDDSHSTGSTETPPSFSSTPYSHCSSDGAPTQRKFKEVKVWPEPEEGDYQPQPGSIPDFRSQNRRNSGMQQSTPNVTTSTGEKIGAVDPKRTSSASTGTSTTPAHVPHVSEAFERPPEDLPPEFSPEVLEQIKRARHQKETGGPKSKPQQREAEPSQQAKLSSGPSGTFQSKLQASAPMEAKNSSGTRSAARDDNSRRGLFEMFMGSSSQKPEAQQNRASNNTTPQGNNPTPQGGKRASANFFSTSTAKSPAQPDAAPPGKSSKAAPSDDRKPPEPPSDSRKSPAKETAKPPSWFGTNSSKQNPPGGQQAQNTKASPTRREAQVQKATEKAANHLAVDMMRRLDQARKHSVEDRKKVFKDLQRELHPDKNIEQAEAAKLAFQKLMEQRENFLAG